MVSWPLLSWTRTLRGMIAMALINLISLGAFGYLAYEARQARISRETAEAQTAADIAEWMATDLYASTAVEVFIGPTMETTRIVETPLFDGPRVLSSFRGEWLIKLVDVEAGVLLCTMPPAGPRSSSYVVGDARVIDMTWAAYTGGDGTCFAEMKPGRTYVLRTFRQATKIINEHAVYRAFDPVRSAPFVFPGAGD